MEDQGWIKLHRQAIKSSIFQNEKYWRIWCWILLKATHEGYKFPFNGKDIILAPGEFITGMSKAKKEMNNLSPQTYRSALSYLKSTGRITVKATNRFSIIQVQNWGKFQDANSPANSQSNKPVTNQQQTSNNIQEYKEHKNVKNIPSVYQQEKPEKKYSNSLVLTRGQTLALAKEFPGLSTTEIEQQRLECNKYMNISSTTYNNPGLFFKAWLRKYLKLQAEKESQKNIAQKMLDALPVVSEEERKRNLEKLVEMRKNLRLGVKR